MRSVPTVEEGLSGAAAQQGHGQLFWQESSRSVSLAGGYWPTPNILLRQGYGEQVRRSTIKVWPPFDVGCWKLSVGCSSGFSACDMACECLRLGTFLHENPPRCRQDITQGSSLPAPAADSWSRPTRLFPAKILELVKDVHAIAVRSETKITREVFAAAPLLKMRRPRRRGRGQCRCRCRHRAWRDRDEHPGRQHRGHGRELTFTHILCGARPSASRRLDEGRPVGSPKVSAA